MKHLISGLKELDRRRFMESMARTALGVSLLPALDRAVAAAPAVGKAKRLIYLYMSGGMTHLDTFDLKPGHENQGSTTPISTAVAGLQVAQYLPTLAKQFGHIAAIRSMFTQTGEHEAGEYFMRTSYEQIATTRHPTIGPWIQHFKGRQSKSLPDTVLISAPARHPGAGFMDPSFSPLPIGDPNRGLENTTPPKYLSDASFDRRLRMINKFDSSFRKKFPSRRVQAYTDLYSEAASLLSSSELKAFDLNEVDAADRNRYGRDQFGQGCLLARRLIENNVRCVEVNLGGWDMHNTIYDSGALPARTANLDRAMGNLLIDLSDRGLLDETLVVLTTEFGRSPVINYNAGRDHHPAVFSAALAGGGIRGGRFYGKSDAEGHRVEENGVSPADFNATIATALGLPVEKEIFSPTGRPFKVAHEGTPVRALLS